MHKMTVIFTTGYAGSGKTTVGIMIAKILHEEWENNEYLKNTYKSGLTTTMAFGDKVKTMVYDLCKLFDIPITGVNALYDVNTKNLYRRYMQQVGTEICQSIFGKQCWCYAIEDDIKHNLEVYPFIIISDLRFEHEYKYFKDNFSNVNTIVINVVKDDVDNTYANHSSEQEFKHIPADITIQNNGTIDDLHENVKDLCQKMLISMC